MPGFSANGNASISKDSMGAFNWSRLNAFARNVGGFRGNGAGVFASSPPRCSLRATLHGFGLKKLFWVMVEKK